MKRQLIISIVIVCTSSVLFASCTRLSLREERTADPAVKQKVRALADKKISNARMLVEKDPRNVQSHIALAAAYLEKVRETGDYEINQIAEKSILDALEIEPGSFEARLLQTQIFLSEHEFEKALKAANDLQALRKDNSGALAAKTDALTELGKYDEAVKAAQKFVDARPNAASFTRVAHLRSLHGDSEGAIEARKLAIRMADPYQKEPYAWYHSELGKDYINIGDFENASNAFDNALKILPGYHWAMAGKGKVLAARGEFAAAALIYERLREMAPETSREIFLGDIYVRMGRTGDAAKIYDDVAARERAKSNGDLHRIALLWADHGQRLEEALEIARADHQVNNDLAASDTYAWALYKKGEFREARNRMKEAMRLKSRNALFHYHLGLIENGLGNKKEAVRNLELAISINPSFDLIQAPIARNVLLELRK